MSRGSSLRRAAVVTALVPAVLAAVAVPAGASTPAGPVGSGQRAAVELAVSADVPVPSPLTSYSAPPEALGRYVPQVSCDPVAKPGALALRQLLRDTYGGSSGGITRSCDSGVTEHSDGRAYDWPRDVDDAQEKAEADTLIAWLVGPDADGVTAGNARRLGVMYVIWNRRIWGSYNGVWKAYTGAVPHTDHVHISLTWDGAMKRTSFWTGTTIAGTDYGPCQLYVSEPVPVYSGRNPSPCPTPSGLSPSAVPLTGDWDGDGTDDLGWYSDGRFHLRPSTGAVVRFDLGSPGDTPVVGDWDGDGADEVGVFRSGTWYLRDTLSAGSADHVLHFGRAGDRPVVGRWDGRREGIGVVRAGTWFTRGSVSSGSASRSYGFGRPTDVPLVGDWDGDGVDGPGVARGARRYVLNTFSRAWTVAATTFGGEQDRPFAGDLDGDGRTTHGAAQGTTLSWSDDPAGGAATSSVVFAG